MKKLADIGEDQLIRHLTAGFPGSADLLVGPGDDCAVWDDGGDSLLLLKTDALVEGVHFEPRADPKAVGWKAISRVASDFAAMGGHPQAYLVTIALRADSPVAWAEALYAGIHDAMADSGGVLAGGETSAVPQSAAALISVAATGRVARKGLTLRSTGRPGDVVAVTGTLGGSLRGKHLSFQPRMAQGEWLARHGVTAMMDLSDGLGRDLPRLAAASGCGWHLADERVPTSPGCSVAEALADGEDYELLVCIPPELLEVLWSDWQQLFPNLPLTPVGVLTANLEDCRPPTGWDHFIART